MADAAAAPAIQVINPANLRGILSTPQTDIPLFYGDPSKDRLQITLSTEQELTIYKDD